MESTEQYNLRNKMVSNEPSNYIGKVLSLYGGTFCCGGKRDDCGHWSTEIKTPIIQSCKKGKPSKFQNLLVTSILHKSQNKHLSNWVYSFWFKSGNLVRVKGQ